MKQPCPYQGGTRVRIQVEDGGIREGLIEAFQDCTIDRMQ
jgi:hypothetical protein